MKDKALFALNSVTNILIEQYPKDKFLEQSFNYFMRKKISYTFSEKIKKEINESINNIQNITLADFYTLLEHVSKENIGLKSFVKFDATYESTSIVGKLNFN